SIAMDEGNGRKNLFIVDDLEFGAKFVRRVNLNTGLITTFAGNGKPEFSGDGGPAKDAGLTNSGIAVDKAGNLFIANSPPGSATGRIRRVDAATGIITTVAGGGSDGGNNVP